MSDDMFRRLHEQFSGGDLWTLVEMQVRHAAAAASRHSHENVMATAEWLIKDEHVERPIELVFRAWWEGLRLTSAMEWAHVHPTAVFLEGRTYRVDLQVTMDAHPGSYGADVWTPYPKIAILFDERPVHAQELGGEDVRDRRELALITDGWTVHVIGPNDLATRPEARVREVLDAVRTAWRGFWSAYWRDVADARKQRLR